MRAGVEVGQQPAGQRVAGKRRVLDVASCGTVTCSVFCGKKYIDHPLLDPYLASLIVNCNLCEISFMNDFSGCSIPKTLAQMMQELLFTGEKGS